MGFRDLVLFYVVTGISLRWIATAASAGPSSIIMWAGAWLLFYTPLALSVIELSSRYPDEGGLYVWTRRAFGDFAGFMCGWIYWTSNLPYFPAVLYFAASNGLFMRRQWQYLSTDSAFFMWFAIVALGLVTLLNIVGLDIGKWLHNLGALGMVLPVAILMGMGVTAWVRFGPATQFTYSTIFPTNDLKELIFWSTIIYAFGGCETASFMAAEVKNPRRNIPRALFFGGVLVTLCYTLGTVSVLIALPHDQVSSLDGLMQAVSATGHRIGFVAVIPAAAALISISNLGAAGAYLAATARLPFVAGIDRFLPPLFGNLHSRWRTPYVALLTQAILGAIFIFLGQAGTSVKGAYDVLVSIGVITYMLPYVFLFAAMFRLQRMPAGADVIRVPGGRPVAIMLSMVGSATASLAIVLSLLPPPDEPNKALAVIKILGSTLVLLAVGVAIYVLGRKRMRRSAVRLAQPLHEN